VAQGISPEHAAQLQTAGQELEKLSDMLRARAR
jgi:hypothetical protein